MLEKGTSGLMSGEGKRAAASRPRTALFLDSTAAATFRRKWLISGELDSLEENGSGGRMRRMGTLVSNVGQSLTLSDLACAFG